MNQITGLTAASPQPVNIILPDGSTVTWNLVYRPNQAGWFYDISWDGLTPPWVCNGNRLVTTPNILRQFRGFLPFGITLTTLDNLEPIGRSDLISGYATAILLTAAEVAAIEVQYFPGLP